MFQQGIVQFLSVYSGTPMSHIRMAENTMIKNCAIRKEWGKEEEEDTFSCLKSPETSGSCWYGSVPLWHQAANLVSKPLWVCKSTKVRIIKKKKYKKAI